MAIEVAMSLQFALLGVSGVGKTSLFQMYLSENRSQPKLTINPACERKEIVVTHLGRPVKVKLSIWDTAGMERFQGLMPQYYRATHGFIIVYDVTSRDSFEALDRVFVDAETFATIEDHVKIVVGNKIDKAAERVVSRAEGLKYAYSKNALFIEASARTNEAVGHIFEKLTVKVLDDSNLWRNVPTENIRLQEPITSPVERSSCCCSN